MIFSGIIIDGTTNWLLDIESIKYIWNEFKKNKKDTDNIAPKSPWITPSI